MGFKDVFKGVLPFLATALPLPPPFGQMAAAAIGKAIGVDNATPATIDDAIAKASAVDPNVLVKLKEVELQFQQTMTAMGIDSVEKLAELDAADRANARAREIAVKDKVPAYLAFAAVIGLYGVVAAVMKWPIPATAHDLLLILIGALVANVNGVYNYYFGSSSGSASKTAILAQQGKPV